MRQSSRWSKEVIDYNFNRGDYRDLLETVNDNPLYVPPVEFNKKLIYQIYQHVHNSLPSEQWLTLETGFNQQKDSLMETFVLIIKAMITITVYFCIVPYFGWLLYILVMITLSVTAVFVYYAYSLMDIVPMAIRRFHHIATSFFKQGEAGTAHVS